MPRRNQEKPPQHSSLCWYFGYDTIITINKTKNKQGRIHQTEKTPTQQRKQSTKLKAV